MNSLHLAPGRRKFLSALALGSAYFTTAGLFAEELMRTPPQTKGPFYPDRLPLDTDNDLLVINDATTPALGEVAWLSGRILDSRGEPIRNAVVEIWQADNNGVYLHRNSENGNRRDSRFQGFGRFLTGSTGEYLFRTIKPVPYPGRAPHIHFAVKTRGREKFTTQCYIQGEPRNDRDFIYNSLREPQAKAAVCAAFVPVNNSRIGELAAKFDIVLGFTPAG